MTIYAEVNTHLRTRKYHPWMVAKRGVPGSPKGTPKPRKRALDPDFANRLKQAMGKVTVPELAAKVKCTRATLLNYVNGDSKTVDPLLLLDIARALEVRLPWLLANDGEMRENQSIVSASQLQLARKIELMGKTESGMAALALIESMTATPVPNAVVEREYKTSERPKIRGVISRPTLFNDDFSGPRKT